MARRGRPRRAGCHGGPTGRQPIQRSIWEVVRLPANETESAQYDIVVIGGGPGGYATALYAGAAGLSVAVVEKDKVGGTCLHRGCVPAKEFLETASVFRERRGGEGIRHPRQPAGRRVRHQPGSQEPGSSTSFSKGFRVFSSNARSRSSPAWVASSRARSSRSRDPTVRCDRSSGATSSSRQARCRGRFPASRWTGATSRPRTRCCRSASSRSRRP